MSTSSIGGDRTVTIDRAHFETILRRLVRPKVACPSARCGFRQPACLSTGLGSFASLHRGARLGLSLITNFGCPIGVLLAVKANFNHNGRANLVSIQASGTQAPIG